MKDFITASYIFTPGISGVGTVALGIEKFDVRRLVAIINQDRGVVIYNTGDTNNRFTSLNGSILTLNVDTSTHLSSDILQIIYNDPSQDDLQETMHEIVSRLNFLGTLRGSDSTLRIGVISGTLPTVTTVTSVGTVGTVANISTIGGFSSSGLVPNWQNQSAILSNINNISIT